MNDERPFSGGAEREPCGGEWSKVIYFGLPMRLCDCPENHIDGFWSFLVGYLPDFNPDGFVFLRYEGSYLRALWRWLSHSHG